MYRMGIREPVVEYEVMAGALMQKALVRELSTSELVKGPLKYDTPDLNLNGPIKYPQCRTGVVRHCAGHGHCALCIARMQGPAPSSVCRCRFLTYHCLTRAPPPPLRASQYAPQDFDFELIKRSEEDPEVSRPPACLPACLTRLPLNDQRLVAG